jgi:hypothetical protein
MYASTALAILLQHNSDMCASHVEPLEVSVVSPYYKTGAGAQEALPESRLDAHPVESLPPPPVASFEALNNKVGELAPEAMSKTVEAKSELTGLDGQFRDNAAEWCTIHPSVLEAVPKTSVSRENGGRTEGPALRVPSSVERPQSPKDDEQHGDCIAYSISRCTVSES